MNSIFSKCLIAKWVYLAMRGVCVVRVVFYCVSGRLNEIAMKLSSNKVDFSILKWSSKPE